MTSGKEERQRDIKEKMQKQVGEATQMKPRKPASDKDSSGINITINGENVDFGVGNTITINYTMAHYPTAAIGVGSLIYIGIGGNLAALPNWQDFGQKWRQIHRQISRKTSGVWQKILQISRNRKLNPNTPQPQPSRHFQPNQATSPVPPNIPLLHNLREILDINPALTLC